MEKIRVFTAFSGYDSQCLALNRIKEMYPAFDYDKEQLNEISNEFNQLDELRILLKKYETGEFELFRVRSLNGTAVNNKTLDAIINRFELNIIKELKAEIKKRETELEGISILQLNKLS